MPRSDRHRPLGAIHFGPGLGRDVAKVLSERPGVHVGGEALSHCLADVVHAHGGNRLDPGVDLRCSQPEAAAAAHADHTDPFAIHEGQAAEEIHSGAEVLDERLR